MKSTFEKLYDIFKEMGFQEEESPYKGLPREGKISHWLFDDNSGGVIIIGLKKSIIDFEFDKDFKVKEIGTNEDLIKFK